MKNIILLILLTSSINSIGQLSYPYKVYSENGDFFIKSIPFSDQVYTDMGKSIVCKTLDSSKVLYSISRYFQPDRLFVSNDGKSVCFVLNWFTPSNDWDRKVVFFYISGALTHSYDVDQFIDSTLNKRIFSLLYKNEAVDSMAEISYGVRASVGVKKGTDPIEEYLNIHNCFIMNDMMYILTQNQSVNTFELKNGNLINKQSFKDFTLKNLLIPKPRKIEKTNIKIPIQWGLPKLSDGTPYETSFAQKMDLLIDNPGTDKYKVYSFEISCSIDSSGLTDNIYVKCKKDRILQDKMYAFIKNSKFDKSEVPIGIEKWYFNDISFFRNKNEEVAIKERNQERIQEEIELQKKIKSDSIDGVYIPMDLNDCFQQLNKILSKSDKEEFATLPEQQAVGKTHFSIGLWMRNNWGLWSGSRLQKYFNKLEIRHPDDMSGIILVSYHRFLNHKELHLEDQVKQSKEYWQRAKTILQDTSLDKTKYIPPTIK